MKTDLLTNRHNGIMEADLPVMLEKIGVSSVDELIDKTIPANIRLNGMLPLGAPMTERQFAEHIASLAAENKLYTSYIGMGWYDSICPAVIQRNVFENPVWYTSYTPYQAEVSQGRLEALLNFQTAVSDLTAMPLANCSLLDEATAAAEAANMMFQLRTRPQQKAGANVLFVDENIFPQNLAVIRTRVIPQGMTILVGDYKTLEFAPEIFGCIIQYPNSNGSVEDYRAFVEKAHEAGCKVAVDADIMSLAMLVPPGEWGADIVFGSTQRLGMLRLHAMCSRQIARFWAWRSLLLGSVLAFLTFCHRSHSRVSKTDGSAMAANSLSSHERRPASPSFARILSYMGMR